MDEPVKEPATTDIVFDQDFPNISTTKSKSHFKILLYVSIGVLLLVIILYLVYNYSIMFNTNSVSNPTTEVEKELNSDHNNNKLSTTDQTDISSIITNKLKDWINALNSRSSEIGSYYSNSINYYTGGNFTRKKVIEDKYKFYSTWDNFNLTMNNPIITKLNEKYIFMCI